MSHYADDVTDIVSRYRYLNLIGETLREYESATGLSIHPEKPAPGEKSRLNCLVGSELPRLRRTGIR